MVGDTRPVSITQLSFHFGFLKHMNTFATLGHWPLDPLVTSFVRCIRSLTKEKVEFRRLVSAMVRHHACAGLQAGYHSVSWLLFSLMELLASSPAINGRGTYLDWGTVMHRLVPLSFLHPNVYFSNFTHIFLTWHYPHLLAAK